MSTETDPTKPKVTPMKDEDWEVISGSKSLEMAKSSPEVTPENKPKAENTDQDEVKLPATPANTPEFNPNPPAYPPTGWKPDGQKPQDLLELPAIQEDTAEEDEDQESSVVEYTPVNSDDEQEVVMRLEISFAIICKCLASILAVYLVCGFIKWSLKKLCQRRKRLTESGEVN